VVAVGLEQHPRAAEIADLLGSAPDHHVAFAALSVLDLAARGHLESLLGAALGLELGHFASLRLELKQRRHGMPFHGRAAQNRGVYSDRGGSAQGRLRRLWPWVSAP